MPIVNMPEAKNALSRLVDASPSGPRPGVARGRFEVPGGIDADNDVVAEMFGTRP